MSPATRSFARQDSGPPDGRQSRPGACWEDSFQVDWLACWEPSRPRGRWTFPQNLLRLRDTSSHTALAQLEAFGGGQYVFLA